MLVLASQTLLAIDGYWEKVQTKNAPSPRYPGTLINIGNGRIAMLGSDTNFFASREHKKQILTEIWIFDINKKDWEKVDFAFPDEVWQNYQYYQPGQTQVFVKYKENQILAHFSRYMKSYEFDSTTWIIDLEKKEWKSIVNKNPKGKPDYHYYQIGYLNEGSVVLYGLDKNKTTCRSYIFEDSVKKWVAIDPEFYGEVFIRDFVTLRNFGEGKIIAYGGLPIGDRYIDSINLWQFEKKTMIWTKLVDKPLDSLVSGNLVPIFENVGFVTKNSLTTGKNKFIKYNSDSYSFDFKNKSFMNKMNIDGEGLISNRQTRCEQLVQGQVLLFGGGNFKEGGIPLELFNDTWIFHADPALSVEGLESKNTKIRKVFVDKKLLITQDWLDNRQIESATLLNLLGSEVGGIELTGNEVKFDCAAGTYLLSIKLDNQEEIRFVIIKN